MSNLCLVLCDHSTSTDPAQGGALTPAILAQIASALDIQLQEDVAPEWGGLPNVRVGAPDASDVGPNEVELAIFDHSDQAGAAGYHAADPRGKAYGRFFRDAAVSLTAASTAGLVLSGILSHEACEIAGDPGANRWADRPDGVSEEALELCDRVEDVSYTITSDDGTKVEVSNFLLPSAFDPGAPPPYDHLAVLAGQTDMTPGGYVIVRQTGAMGSAGEKWQPPAGEETIALAKKVLAHGLAGLPPKTLARKMAEGSRTRRRGVTFESDKA
jgi:hypothetical protein